MLLKRGTGNGERGTSKGNGRMKTVNKMKLLIGLGFKLGFVSNFSFSRSLCSFPVPRSPFPVPRSPFPVPRSPFPVPSLSNTPLVCTGRKNGFTGNGVGIGVVSGAVRAHMTFWTSEMGVASGVIRATESESEAEAEGQTSHNARSHAWFSSSASARDSDGPVFTWS